MASVGIVSATYEFGRSRPTDLCQCVDLPLKPDSPDHKKNPPTTPNIILIFLITQIKF